MALKTWYATNTVFTPHQEMSETSPGAEATSDPATGWRVAGGTGDYALLAPGLVLPGIAFGASPIEPDGTVLATGAGDCFRTANTLSGDFAAGNWTFAFVCIATAGGGAHDGNSGCRLHRSTNANGAGATELTSSRSEGSAVVDLDTGASQASTATVSLPAFSLSNEYLFWELGWERVGAGSGATSNVIMRVGDTGTRLVSTNFTPPYDHLPGLLITSGRLFPQWKRV